MSRSIKLNEDQRFYQSIGYALLGAVLVGVLSGFLRSYYNSFVFLLAIGVAISSLIRKVGRGVSVRFSLLSLASAWIAIFISDVACAYGLMGLFDLQSYALVLQFISYADGGQIMWVVWRVLTLALAYTYSRVV